MVCAVVSVSNQLRVAHRQGQLAILSTSLTCCTLRVSKVIRIANLNKRDSTCHKAAVVDAKMAAALSFRDLAIKLMSLKGADGLKVLLEELRN